MTIILKRRSKYSYISMAITHETIAMTTVRLLIVMSLEKKVICTHAVKCTERLQEL